ncbi:N-acetylmuramoyl-L-alanine amidase [Actinomadura keratinilytica]|uniref:N-acetylmuramoyl-L-alanine amidase n=1 Tax=Actinomadura keratinilytica TaxID=547461 RepID=A0ABP7Y6R8_9ACTN
MLIQRGASAAAGLALCLAALTACGGDGGNGGSSAGAAEPPTASGGGDATTGAAHARQDDAAPLRGKVVVLDPGHNGGNAKHPAQINKQVEIGNGRKECDTTGTSTDDGYPEHAFTWDVSKRLAKILRAEGAKVVLTRPDDTGVGPCITERAAIGNRAKADAALSIHADGASASGHGFHVIQPRSVKGQGDGMVPASRRLGRAIRDAYRAGTGLPYSTYLGKDGLDSRDDLGGLNLSKVPKVFIECGNMRNSGDAAKLSSAAFRQRIAEALAKGLDDYLT